MNITAEMNAMEKIALLKAEAEAIAEAQRNMTLKRSNPSNQI